MTNSSSTSCKPSTRTDVLPPWKIILHDDNTNTAEHVVLEIQKITRLDEKTAVERVVEAHEKGVASLLTTHKEKAELIVEMFASCDITVTMEKA